MDLLKSLERSKMYKTLVDTPSYQVDNLLVLKKKMLNIIEIRNPIKRQTSTNT